MYACHARACRAFRENRDDRHYTAVVARDRHWDGPWPGYCPSRPSPETHGLDWARTAQTWCEVSTLRRRPRVMPMRGRWGCRGLWVRGARIGTCVAVRLGGEAPKGCRLAAALAPWG